MVGGEIESSWPAVCVAFEVKKAVTQFQNHCKARKPRCAKYALTALCGRGARSLEESDPSLVERGKADIVNTI